MNKIRRVLFLLTLSTFVGIFYFNINTIQAANFGDVIISEVMASPMQKDNYNEWVEIYNSGDENVDLSDYALCNKILLTGYIDHADGQTKVESGMMLGADKYAIITDGGSGTDVYSNFQVDQNALALHVAASSLCKGLTNSGKAVVLKKDESSIYTFRYSTTEKGKSFSLIDGSIQITNPTPGTANQIVEKKPEPEPEPEEDDENKPPDGENNNQNSSSDDETEETHATGVPGSVVINELVSDPEDGPEWIELYNKTGDNIDLTGWQLEEGSEAQTNLEGILTAHGYLVIENPKGNLNNTGDIIILSDYYGNAIDQIAYGKWDDGNINDNAPKTKDPNGIGRIGNSQDTNNDLADWQIVSILTKGAANILIIEKSEAVIISTLKNKIIINEIFPNPAGSDEKEFIELKNISEEEIDLAGLIIGDNSKRRYKIKSNGEPTKMAAGEFFVIPRSKSKLALNNTGGDKVVLYDNEKNIIDEAGYTEKAPEGKSYALVEGIWQWTDQPTAGEANIFIKENQPPIAVIDLDKSEILIDEEIILDGSDSYDPEGENLIVEWQVSHKNIKTQEHKNNRQLYHFQVLKLTFDEIGVYEVKLMISDGEISTVEQVMISVVESESLAPQCCGTKPSPESATNINLNLINEFLPNPAGSDDAEFIELYNSNETAIDLSGFFLDDQEGGSRLYQIPAGIILEPFNYFVFEREETRLALNNTNDSVRLLDKEKNILQQVDYDEVVEGASFARALDGKWFWTEIITKGEENQIAPISQEITKSKISNKKKADQPAIEIALNQIREMDLGDKIKTRGIVSVEPGILGSQIFYIQNPPSPSPIKLRTGSCQGGTCSSPPDKGDWGVSGIQIYSYKKDFPPLKVGDEVEVAGALSQNRGEYRIKTKQKDDIEILGQEINIEPLKIANSEIGEETEGSLLRIEGEIIEMKGSNIFLDDGSEEVKIYLKKSTGIKKTKLKEGDIVTITGIASQTTTGWRLLPRYQDDIIKVKVKGKELIKLEEEEQDNSDIIIEPRNNDWLKYTTATLGAIVLILLIVSVRMYKRK